MNLTLRLMGPVRLTAPEGKDLTPHGQKARGILALLGTAAELRMPRTRLQDRLWSNRPLPQGADSLRQTLREIRIILGLRHRDALISGSGWVGLDPNRVSIDLRPTTGISGEREEFAADLDIPDPEFENWLRNTRLRLEDESIPSAPRQKIALVISEPDGQDERARLIASMFLNEAAARAAELIPAHLISSPQPVPPTTGIGIGLLAITSGSEIDLLAVLRDLELGHQIQVLRYRLPRDRTIAEVGREIVASIALSLVNAAGTIATSPRQTFPLRDIFSFSRERLLNGDRQLAQMAEDMGENAVGLSMRAFLRYTMIIERQTQNPGTRLDEAQAFAAQAREAAPFDPITLSVSSLLRSWRGDVTAALELARMAQRVAPGHELAQFALSQALTDAGLHHEALIMSLKVNAGPMATLGRATWLLRRSVAQIRVGRLADAENSAAAALVHAPDNRPALRFLAALRFNRGDETGAATALTQLRRLEPDFSLSLMASPEYPVSTLRHAKLLNLTQSAL